MASARMRGKEIKFLIERELRNLYVPCSVSDIVRRIGASRIPVEKYLHELLKSGMYPYIGIVRVGGVDILYRIVKPNTEVGVDGRTEKVGSELGGSQQGGQAGEQVLQAAEQHEVHDDVHEKGG